VQPNDGGEPITITPEHVILATGLPAGGAALPAVQRKRDLVEGALQLDRVPERLVVVGGGYIGVELGSAFAKFGSQVTIVEAQERILPLYDKAADRPRSASGWRSRASPCTSGPRPRA
jgi:dihydrolipoamide dehydrogenase